MIVVNFKTYGEATGKQAKKLADKCAKASKDSGKKVVVAPQNADLLRAEETDVEVFGQHIDPVEPGSHTGHSVPEALKQAGASGTLINHSERRLENKKIEKAVKRAKEKDLTTIVCAQSPEECERYSRYEPEFVAFEPPELIGGDISVSRSKPELIQEAVERSDAELLTGAGVKDAEDVSRSLELGCKGVLVASGVVKSDDEYLEVRELCSGL